MGLILRNIMAEYTCKMKYCPTCQSPFTSRTNVTTFLNQCRIESDYYLLLTLLFELIKGRILCSQIVWDKHQLYNFVHCYLWPYSLPNLLLTIYFVPITIILPNKFTCRIVLFSVLLPWLKQWGQIKYELNKNMYVCVYHLY